jgi:hypothetical protein
MGCLNLSKKEIPNRAGLNKTVTADKTFQERI